MKIVQVCPRYYPHIGGVENHVREICERLAMQHDVEVVTADRSADLPHSENINKVRVTRFKPLGSREAYYLSPSMYRYLHTIHADIIHAHNYHAFPALFASWSASPRGFVFTPHFHGKGSTLLRDLLNKPYQALGRRIFKRADRIICVSGYEKNLVREKFPDVNEEKILVIPNGVPLEAIRNAPLIQQDENLLMYIGRLDRYKNIQLVVRSMEYLPDVTFLIIGSAGNYRETLEQLIEDLGLGQRVRILQGMTDSEKYSYLKSCSLFVNLSGTEAFGITVLEALAAGKPVVVNGKGGLSDLANKFHSITPVDVDFIKDNSGYHELALILREKMGGMFSEDLSSYDWASIVGRLESVYQEILAPPG